MLVLSLCSHIPPSTEIIASEWVWKVCIRHGTENKSSISNFIYNCLCCTSIRKQLLTICPSCSSITFFLQDLLFLYLIIRGKTSLICSLTGNWPWQLLTQGKGCLLNPVGTCATNGVIQSSTLRKPNQKGRREGDRETCISEARKNIYQEQFSYTYCSSLGLLIISGFVFPIAVCQTTVTSEQRTKSIRYPSSDKLHPEKTEKSLQSKRYRRFLPGHDLISTTSLFSNF